MKLALLVVLLPRNVLLVPLLASWRTRSASLAALAVTVMWLLAVAKHVMVLVLLALVLLPRSV